MIKTYVLDIHSLPDPLEQEAYMACLPKERVEKIRRSRHPDTRKQSLGAGLLLNDVLQKQAPDADIGCHAYGKPFCTGLAFNLSHTTGYVVLSVWSSRGQPAFGQLVSRQPALEQPVSGQFDSRQLTFGEAADFMVGCDIEPIRPYEARVARRFFTEAEYHSLEAAKDAQAQAELFCRYWTKKESVLKLTGLGMSLPMDLFDVRAGKAVVDTQKTAGWYVRMQQKHQEKPEDALAYRILMGQDLYLKEYRFHGCCIAVCGLTSQFAPDITEVSGILPYAGGRRAHLLCQIQGA